MTAFAFAVLGQLGHGAAEEASEFRRFAAADVGMLPPSYKLPATVHMAVSVMHVDTLGYHHLAVLESS